MDEQEESSQRIRVSVDERPSSNFASSISRRFQRTVSIGTVSVHTDSHISTSIIAAYLFIFGVCTPPSFTWKEDKKKKKKKNNNKI